MSRTVHPSLADCVPHTVSRSSQRRIAGCLCQSLTPLPLRPSPLLHKSENETKLTAHNWLLATSFARLGPKYETHLFAFHSVKCALGAILLSSGYFNMRTSCVECSEASVPCVAAMSLPFGIAYVTKRALVAVVPQRSVLACAGMAAVYTFVVLLVSSILSASLPKWPSTASPI